MMRSKNYSIETGKPAPGRFDPENPTIIELAKEYNLSPEEYLNDPNAHSGRFNEIGELDTTINEWMGALEVKDDLGYTIKEIFHHTGVSESTIRRKIKQLIKQGKCVKGSARRFTDGRCRRWNVYHLTGEEE